MGEARGRGGARFRERFRERKREKERGTQADDRLRTLRPSRRLPQRLYTTTARPTTCHLNMARVFLCALCARLGRAPGSCATQRTSCLLHAQLLLLAVVHPVVAADCDDLRARVQVRAAVTHVGDQKLPADAERQRRGRAALVKTLLGLLVCLDKTAVQRLWSDDGACRVEAEGEGERGRCQ